MAPTSMRFPQAPPREAKTPMGRSSFVFLCGLVAGVLLSQSIMSQRGSSGPTVTAATNPPESTTSPPPREKAGSGIDRPRPLAEQCGLGIDATKLSSTCMQPCPMTEIEGTS